MKNELVSSFVDDDIFDNDELNKKAYNLRYYQEAMPIVKEYETKMQKKNILNVAYKEPSKCVKWSRNLPLASQQFILRLTLLNSWINIQS